MNKRIEWVDIFKAFAIILVVVGHSTGLFNKYIYQFHMAAFFFISGYTENLTSKTTFETITNKAYRLILPLITMFFIMLLFVACLNRIGWYNIFFQDIFIGFFKSIREFFKGIIYINWLGATWFLGVLFGIILIQKIIHGIFKQALNLIYMIISLLMFLLGYFMVSTKTQLNIFVLTLDLIFIAQFYFMIGNVCKKLELVSKIISNKIIRLILFFLTIFLLWYFGNVHPTTVDYPSRKFGIWIIDAMVAINGIIFLAIISYTIPEIKVRKIKNLLILIGKNTLGILFLHFLNFKISYMILAILEIVPWTYLSKFIPSTEIGNRYWWMISSISIGVSIVEWKLINKSQIGYTLFGQNKVRFEEVNTILMKRLHINSIVNEKPTSIHNGILEIQINKIIKYIINNKVILSIILILIILITAPMMNQGIIINDELQARFWSMQGFNTFFMHYFDMAKNQGRFIMAFPMTIFMYSSFITSNSEIFRLFSIIGILLNVGLFAILIYKLFRNKAFCIFTGLSILIFLPITFEHTSPNAFVNLFSIPFSFLLISLILFINYLKKDDIKSIILSCAVLFIALSGYEIFIMFTPLYLLIILYITPKGEKLFKNLFLKLVWPVVTTSIYLVAYFSSRILMPSNYEGNQIGFTILGFVNIVKQLFKASIPGYYVFNKKYEYIFNMYASNGYELLIMRIILILTFFIGILIYVFKVGKIIKRNNNTFLHDATIVFCGLIFTIIPTFPNAMAKMYQGNVNGENYIALPVTYFTYFFMAFTICYVIWQIIQKLNTKIIYGLVIILLGFYCIPVQVMNDTFSRIQGNDYDRMITIEQFLETNTMKELNNNSILAPDLYIQKNALAIHEGYWKDFAKIKGLNLDISGKKENQKIVINYPNSKYFEISAGDIIVILSKESLNDITVPVNVQNSKNYQKIMLKSYTKDQQFYVYALKNYDGEISQINNEKPLQDFRTASGNTLETSEKLFGYYISDGWLEKQSKFNIKAGEQGKIIMQGYYPFEITDNLTGVIYINDVPNNFKITQENFKVECPAPQNNIVSVRIECNFDKQASQADLRRIAFVLKSLDGK